MLSEAAGKAIMVSVVFCGALIASFYFAYLLLLVAALGGVGGIAYWYFKSDFFAEDENFPD